MRTVFIINPKAGQGKAKELVRAIHETAERLQADISIYLTQSVYDAEKYVRDYCRKHTEGEIRFIACGGDGTLNEVLNGAIDCPRAIIGVIPEGTGNDFCRNFEGVDFSSIEAQLQGEPVLCDAIRYSGLINGQEQTRYCANMFNIGFDSNVADKAGSLKQLPLVSGSLAYLLAVLVMMIKKKGANLRIELDGKVEHEGRLLLTSIGNGRFCGGGIQSNPAATLHDGVMDINIVNDVTRPQFISLLPKYMKGTHTGRTDVGRFCLKVKKAVITPLDGSMRLCTDGEITDAGTLTFEAVADAFRFNLPRVQTPEE